jgi:hypothetical protein
MTPKLIAAAAIAVLFFQTSLYSQSKDSVAQLILHKDSIFWCLENGPRAQLRSSTH